MWRELLLSSSGSADELGHGECGWSADGLRRFWAGLEPAKCLVCSECFGTCCCCARVAERTGYPHPQALITSTNCQIVLFDHHFMLYLRCCNVGARIAVQMRDDHSWNVSLILSACDGIPVTCKWLCSCGLYIHQYCHTLSSKRDWSQ